MCFVLHTIFPLFSMFFWVLMQGASKIISDRIARMLRKMIKENELDQAIDENFKIKIKSYVG